MRHPRFSSFLIALFVLGLVAGSPAEAKKKEPKAEEAAEEAKDGGEEAPAEKKKKKKNDDPAFDEVIEDFEKIEGLFTFYRNDREGKVYLALEPEQFDEIYLCSITRSAADGWFFDSGAMLNDFPFVFHRVGKKVQMLHKNVYFRADPDAAISRAIGRGLSDSLVGTGKIASAPHEETGAILVDPAGFFVQDVAMVSYIFQEFIKEPTYSYDGENSYFGPVKSFPQNTEIDVVLHFKAGKPGNVPTLADSRSFRHIYHYSLSAIPETSFQPRLADDRVGHFLTMHQDMTSQLTETPYVRYVNRWHLEKAEPKFELSKPRKPIVFWIENTVPVQWRDAVREGTLLWNQAFERIGFKDAIEVRQMPDDADWDPADVRYNVIRWIAQPGAGYAVGPSRTNPFTGQIYDADVRVAADMIRFLYRSFEEFAAPSAIGDRFAAELGLTRHDGRGFCDHQDGLRRQAAFGWSLVAARGDLAASTGGAQLEEFLHQFIVELMAHEIGHTLGFRHNFKASTIRTTSNLNKTGQAHSGSVMDYNPVNLAPKGAKQGSYYQTILGPYDYWVVEYAYKPVPAGESEAKMLDKIASRAADPMLAYGTDEDAFFGPRGMDPSATRWDLGADSVAYYANRLELADELWASLESKFEQSGERYQRMRRVFNQGLGEYRGSTFNVAKYIGGIYHHRDHIGDPNGRRPYEPVPAAQQREALDFLTSEILSPDAFPIPPSLMDKLASERWWDFSGSVWQQPRNDYPLLQSIWQVQAFPLDHLYSPLLAQRVLDIELRGNGTLTLADIYGELRGAIWAELDSGANVNAMRRGLQRMHLERLIGLVVSPPPGTPEDACALARADLKTLQGRIEAAAGSGSLDAYTTAHLDEAGAMIAAALEAGIQRQIAG